MEDDYELVNARTWNLDLAANPRYDRTNAVVTDNVDDVDKANVDEGEWAVVGGSRKRNKKISRPSTSLLKPQGSTPSTHAESTKPRFQFKSTVVRKAADTHATPRNQVLPDRRTASKKLPIPRLFDGNDSSAEREWRKGQNPTTTFMIKSRDLLLIRANGDMPAQPDTFVQLQKPLGQRGFQFGVWGAPDRAENVITEIRAYIKKLSTSKQGNSDLPWAHVRSLTDSQRLQEETRWMEEVQRQVFRMLPPLKQTFGAIGTFHWPSEEYRADEILGTSHQALDPIRMDACCYIVFDKEESIFQVMGSARNVRTALMRIKKTVFQIVARQLVPVRAYLLHHGNSTSRPAKIVLQSRSIPALLAPSQKSVESSYSICGQGVLTQESQTPDIDAIFDISRIRIALEKALAKLHFTRGHIQLKVGFGMFILESYEKQTESDDDAAYDLAAYASMTLKSQFKARVSDQ